MFTSYELILCGQSNFPLINRSVLASAVRGDAQFSKTPYFPNYRNCSGASTTIFIAHVNRRSFDCAVRRQVGEQSVP